jgi:hypothetical protein
VLTIMPGAIVLGVFAYAVAWVVILQVIEPLRPLEAMPSMN